jgi:hypothetical protein
MMRAAALPGVTALDRCVVPGDYRRAIRRSAGVSFGTLTAAGGTAGAATLAAVWMIAAAMSGSPHLPGLGDTPNKLTFNRFDDDFAGTTIARQTPAAAAAVNRLPVAPSSNAAHDKGGRLNAVRRVRFPRERFAFAPVDEGEREAAALDAGNVAPNNAQPGVTPPSGYVAAAFDLFDPQPTLAARLAQSSVAVVPVPPARTATNDAAPRTSNARAATHAAAPLLLADAEAQPSLPPIADTAPAPHSTLTGFLQRLFSRKEASINPDTTPVLGAHTAIYDIEARVVYLPDGEKLEAHSGLGAMMDDPHYITKKGRGPTPPNVYDLVLRDGSFHGVQAIRLKPVNDDKMYGRDGILAHPYMLGASGQSFGCVSFKDYPRFLKAFENGEVDRLVVVPHRGDYPRYAAND